MKNKKDVTIIDPAIKDQIKSEYKGKKSLDLNFGLDTGEERVEEINTIVEQRGDELSPKDLEQMANYVLWGRDAESGTNLVDENYIINPSKNTTWKAKKTTSLEELITSPVFNEIKLLNPVPYKAPTFSFNREVARKEAPKTIKAELEKLWRQIDLLDYEIAQYEYTRGDRRTPPRDELLERLPEQHRQDLDRKIEREQTPYTIIKKKRLLVELRQTQYTLRDSYAAPRRASEKNMPPVLFHSIEINTKPVPLTVRLPVHLHLNEINPKSYPPEERASLARGLVEVSEDCAMFNLADPEVLYNLFAAYDDILDLASRPLPPESTVGDLAQLLIYLREETKLDPHLQIVLQGKLDGLTNAEIKDKIKKEIGREYGENYISTLYTKIVMREIAHTAEKLCSILTALDKPNKFKECAQCGRLLLRSPDFFGRRSSSNDGYQSHCKECGKENRLK